METTERRLRHQHSESSDIGRALVPMWDSSDPNRAPAPLPLNPQSPNASISRAGTSRAIESAHAALAERAREHALVPSALSRRTTDERSPTRVSANIQHLNSTLNAATSDDGAGLNPRVLQQHHNHHNHHRRMKSTNPGTVRDLSLQIEQFGGQVLGGSPTKNGAPPVKHRDSISDFRSVPEKDQQQQQKYDAPAMPIPGPSLTPARPSAMRRPQHSILGENTPPQSATMLALQNMAPSHSHPKDIDSTPLANMTNGQTALPKGSASLEALSGQIAILTNIASGLQKEMNALSRRSRDNATDLLSLKEATNARDEDIRKSLRDLITHNHHHDAPARPPTRDTYAGGLGGGLYIEGRPHGSSPMSKPIHRPFSLPRIPSPNSFAASSIDQESTLDTPSLYGGESQTIVTMLEKVMRDMGTRECQDDLARRIGAVIDKVSATASSAKLDEVIELLRARLDSALVPMADVGGAGGNGGGNGRGRPRVASPDSEPEPARKRITFDLDTPPNGPAAADGGKDGKRSSSAPPKPSDIIGEDFVKVIQSIKDSVSQSGGLTAEVKALVRELRGEILGMGREIGRKLDQAQNGSSEIASSIASDAASEAGGRDEMAQIIDEGLGKMKDQLNNILREHRRQSTAHSPTSKPPVDYQEIYNAMRNALKDSNASSASTPAQQLSREDVMAAVKDVWESYKPELEERVNVGLHTDEVLACLKQGMDEYASAGKGASREEVSEAMMEALKSFVPPRVDTPASLSRDEILDAVRECLEEFEFPVAPGAVGAELTRDDMVHAVKEGLSGLELPLVSNALVPVGGGSEGGSGGSHAGDSNEAISQLRGLMEALRDEFKAVADETKKNVSATEHDSAIILDATKEGLDKLRSDIESYIAKSGGETSGQHEQFMEGVAGTLETFKTELVEVVSNMTADSKTLIEGQIDNFRDVLAGSVVPSSSSHVPRDETLAAVRDSLDALRSEVRQSSGRMPRDLDIFRETLGDLRISIDELIRRSRLQDPSDPVMEEVRSNLMEVQSDLRAMREESQNKLETALVRVGDEEEVLGDDSEAGEKSEEKDGEDKGEDKGEERTVAKKRLRAEMLKQEDIKGLELMISQLQTKIETMGPGGAPQLLPSKDDFAHIEQLITSSAFSKENMARIQELLGKAVSKEDLTRLEGLLGSLQKAVDGIAARAPVTVAAAVQVEEKPRAPITNPDDAATREDVVAIETLLRNTKARLDDLMDGEQAVRKDHIDGLEVLVNILGETVTAVREEIDGLPSRQDVVVVDTLVKDMVVSLAEMKESLTKQLADPARITKAETDAIQAACVDIKAQLDKTDFAEVSTKEDIRAVEALLKEAKEALNAQAEAQSQAVESRQAEIAGVGERVTEVHAFIEQARDMLKEKVESSASGIEAVGTVLERLGTTIDGNATVGQDVKDMLELIKTEFDETKSSVAGAKLETGEKLESAISTLGSRIDEKIGEIMVRFDGVHSTMEENKTAADGYTTDMDAAVKGTKVMAEELKLLIDTLGSTVTDSLEKMEEASKTVFVRVDELVIKSDEHYTDNKTEHEQTRDHVVKTLAAVEGLQGQVVEYHPRLLDAVKEIMTAVGEQFERARGENNSLVARFVEAIPEQQMLPPIPDKYDDSVVHEKLDQLVTSSSALPPRFDTLDEVHKQVNEMARGMAEFLAQQAKRIQEDDEDREKMLHDTSLALERKLVLKDETENSIDRLKEEEARLRASVEALRSDEQVMTKSKMRLAADVSSLETALLLRREELQEMEKRAEGLERRILDGAMNHSRLLMLGSGGSSKAPDAMNRKRVKKSEAAQMALKRSVGPAANSQAANRRIVSLSQIPNNTVSSIKRSQSVKTPGGMGAQGTSSLRKASWGESLSGRSTAIQGGEDEENIPPVPAMEESETANDADTLRRCSGMTTIIKEMPEEGEGEVVDETDGHGPTTMSDDGSMVEVRGDEIEVSEAS